MLSYAIAYVKSGFPVIPLCYPSKAGDCSCGRRHTGNTIGKAPITKNGLKDAATTTEQVIRFWTEYPSANIGVVIPDGYFVLDVDIVHNGFASLEKLQKYNGEITETLQITTGSGGAHLWYKTNKPIKNTIQLAGFEGLDIRGIGGYVVSPPSIHRSGNKYIKSPIWDGPITQAPDWLINLCFKKPIPNNPIASDRPLTEGSRNSTLTSDAGAMRRRGFSKEAIFQALMITNNERCQPPLDEKEVLTIAQSINRYSPETTQSYKQTGYKGLK